MVQIKRRQFVFVICCILVIALSVSLLSYSYMSNQDDKVTIGRMLAYAFDNQKFVLLRLQSDLKDVNDELLLLEIAQLEAIKNFNFFDTGLKKLSWDLLYEDLFKEV